MASLEKLIRTLDQLQITEISNLDTSIKKKEIKTHILNIVEFNCSPNVQNHKDFVSYIASSIDSLIRLCDSKDSDIRLASDEGLYKVIKALLPLHSNRILVELCKQIKKSESPRILKLSMNRFAELCHLARPQKRRAYLANLFNAISVVTSPKLDKPTVAEDIRLKMIPLTGIISLVVFTLFSGVLCFENNVPVYMWNIDTDAVVNPLHSLNAEELVGKVSLSLEQKLVALFMQDELSVDDFKSNDLAALKSLAEMENDGTFYAPSVTKTIKLPEVLEAAGYSVVYIKSHQDLPTSPVVGKTVLVIDLPATQLGDLRKENLQLNSNAITEMYEILKSQQSDVVGIFTAKKNSQLQLDESRRRIARSAAAKSAPREETFVDKFYNITQDSGKLFLFFEKAPILKIKDENKTEWANFTLNVDPELTGTVVNETSKTGVLVLTYKALVPAGPKNDTGFLTKATISFRLSTKRGYWYINQTSIDFDVKINDATFVENDLVLVTTDVSTPLGRSWHCTPKSRLASYGYYFNGTIVKYTNKVILETDGFQLQPFKVSKEKFGDGYDCVGFFTEGIWAAIILGLIIAMMLAWAISMLADVRTPDRYDDPKGKTITITATD